MGNFTYSVVPVSVIKVKIPVPFFFFRLSVQFNKMKVTLSFYTMDLKVVTERYMYTFRPMVECQKINIFFFLPSCTNLSSTCKLFEREEKYFNAFLTEYGTI